jgi:hypothetical protein
MCVKGVGGGVHKQVVHALEDLWGQREGMGAGQHVLWEGRVGLCAG